MKHPSLLFFKNLPTTTDTALVRGLAKLLKIDHFYLDVAVVHRDVVYSITTKGFISCDIDFFLQTNRRDFTTCSIGGDLTWLDDHLLSLSSKKLSIVKYLNVFIQCSNLSRPFKRLANVLTGSDEVSLLSVSTPCQLITRRPQFYLPYALYNNARTDTRVPRIRD